MKKITVIKDLYFVFSCAIYICTVKVGVPDAGARGEILSIFLESGSHQLTDQELRAIAQVWNYLA